MTSEDSANLLRKSFSEHQDRVQIFQGQNVKVASESDVVVLSCPQGIICTALNEEGMREALHGKVLVSVAAGVTREQIAKAANDDESSSSEAKRCWVFRAMPNLAASVGESATAIEVSEPIPPTSKSELVDSVFEGIGKIAHVPASSMNACTALCGSTPAFIALFTDALIDGAVVAGVSRSAAEAMAVQVLSSTAALLQNGQRPSTLRENVCASPGCTIEGIMTLEQGGVRGATAKAMRDAIVAAGQLG